jgi:hypothetical protein
MGSRDSEPRWWLDWRGGDKVNTDAFRVRQGPHLTWAVVTAMRNGPPALRVAGVDRTELGRNVSACELDLVIWPERAMGG